MYMKRIHILLIISFITLKSWGDVVPRDFVVDTEFGMFNCYLLNGDTTAGIKGLANDASVFDTIIIPPVVFHETLQKEIIITELSEIANLKSDSCRIRNLFISKNINKINDYIFGRARVENIIVDTASNHFSSKDGVLFSKDMKAMIHYPNIHADSIYIPDGVSKVGTFCIFSTGIKKLVAPLSLKRFDAFSVIEYDLEDVITQDSVKVFDYASITTPNLRTFVMGNQVDSVVMALLASNYPIELTCRTIQPPVLWLPENGYDTTNLALKYLEQSTLYVPRRSVERYRRAENWNRFGDIRPIEPPIVTGIDTADISWVQNFSATSYTWTLYLDSAKTEQFMQLTFDMNGILTSIDFSHVQNAPALHNEEETPAQEKRFAQYYSFTIRGLSPNTPYYFTRLAYSGSEIIEEENGSFVTQQASAITNTAEDNRPSSYTKYINDGHLIIETINGERYDSNGRKIK